MMWIEVRDRIMRTITVGTEINSEKSKCRIVMEENQFCNRYDYNGEEGYIVKIGESKNNYLEIPWSMLEKCYKSLSDGIEYGGDFFRSVYPKQAADHGCHVHVVGMIFVKSGIAQINSKNNNYSLVNNKQAKVLK